MTLLETPFNSPIPFRTASGRVNNETRHGGIIDKLLDGSFVFRGNVSGREVSDYPRVLQGITGSGDGALQELMKGLSIYPLPYDSRSTYHLEEDQEALRKAFIFHDAARVWKFLIRHRAVRQKLIDAVPELEKAFELRGLFKLELSQGDDDPMIYAVAVWNGSIQSAVDMLRKFEEDWWLDNMSAATTNLAFVYEIA